MQSMLQHPLQGNQQAPFDKNNPFLANIKERRPLTSPKSNKETQHCVIDITDSGLVYTCGDSCGIYPTNDPKVVDAILHTLGFDPEAPVVLPKHTHTVSLRSALLHFCALAQPTKKFLLFLETCLQSPKDQATLKALLSLEPEALQEYLKNCEYLDLLASFTSVVCTPQAFASELRKLQPRLYSIASSPSLFPNEVHFSVAVVRYTTSNQTRHGVASTYLSDRVLLGKEPIPIFIAPSHFGLPENPNADVIMIGPGTGVAPFRAFLQERAYQNSKGRNWLFFGEQHAEHDFLYKEDWEKHLATGVLTRLDTAFSRDQAQKIYVQHRMHEQAQLLWEWIKGGAYLYVCGDAKNMAKDVENALLTIFQNQGPMELQTAQAYLKTLKQEKRYQKDVY